MSIILQGRRRAKTTTKESRVGIAGPRFSCGECHFYHPLERHSRTDLTVVMLRINSGFWHKLKTN